MKIKTISATGLKSGDFKLNLEPVTIITGKNFTGKTSRLDAIRLGLIGYIPELGKQGSSTMALARNGIIDIGLTTDAGNIRRTWERQRNSVKAESTGELPAVPPVLLDSNEYFSLGSKDRMRYVFGLANIETEWDGARIVAALRNIRLETNTPDTDSVLNKLVGEVDASDDARHDQGRPIQDWLTEVIEDVRNKCKASKQTVDRMAKSAQAATQLGSTELAMNRQAEITRLQNQLDGLHTRRGEINSQIRSGTEQELIIAGWRSLVAKESELIKEHDEFLKAQPERVDLLMSAAETARNERFTLSQELAHSNAELKRIGAELDNVGRLTCCPTCHSKKKGWKDAWEKLLQSELDRLTGENIKIKSRYQAADAAEAPARDAYNNARKAADRLAQIKPQLNAMEDAKAALINARTPEGIEALKAELVTVDRDIETAINQLSHANTSHREWIRQQAETATRAKAVIELRRAEAEASIYAAALKVLETLQAEMVDGAFAGIVDRANKLVGSILKTPLAYVKGEIGRLQDGKFICHEAFSGSEKALAYAAISIALASNSPFRIVMLDEMGRLSKEKAMEVLDKMASAVDNGIIDQFIGIDVANRYADYSGVKVEVL